MLFLYLIVFYYPQYEQVFWGFSIKIAVITDGWVLIYIGVLRPFFFNSKNSEFFFPNEDIAMVIGTALLYALIPPVRLFFGRFVVHRSVMIS